MKKVKFYASWLVLGGTLLADPVTVPSLGPRFKQTRERAAALFEFRNGTYPPIDPRFNLFRSPPETSTVPIAPMTNEARDKPPVVSEEVILQEALAALKKGGGGIVALGGRIHFTFNQKTYKDGDSISVPVRGRPVDIYIVRVSSNSVTLALNQSEAVWRF